jgi:hypothetical protein
VKASEVYILAIMHAVKKIAIRGALLFAGRV